MVPWGCLPTGAGELRAWRIRPASSLMGCAEPSAVPVLVLGAVGGGCASLGHSQVLPNGQLGC